MHGYTEETWNEEVAKEDPEAIGLATYSNSKSTVLSYASIFENLWIQSEMINDNIPS
jgi:hypothetical protein